MTEVEHKPRPFVDLIVSVIIPSTILIQLSDEDKLGPVWALVVALAFPIGWGLYELIKYRKRNYIAVLGLVSTLFTGGIALLEIDSKWFAVKEAAFPTLIGLGVFIAHKLGYPVIKKLLLNPQVMHVEKIEQALEKNNTKLAFEKTLDRANYLFAGTFVFSAIMNFVLAKTIVVSESGTKEFNQEVGRMGYLSYPVIMIPSVIMMLAIFYFMWRRVNSLTGLKLEEVMIDEEKENKE